MARIRLSPLRSLVHEIAINGWGVLWRTENDFSLWRLIEYPRMTEYLDLEPGDRLLDLGSGTSSYPLMLAREGARVVVVELDRERTQWQAAQARAGKAAPGKIDAVVADASRLPFRDRSFARVTSVSAIEHMEDDASVGSEMARVMEAHGIGAISVPFTNGEREHFFRGIKAFDRRARNEFVQRGKGTLVRFYAPEDVEQRFGSGVGCKITRRSFFGRTILNDWYHETRLNRFWRRFILKDWLLAVLVHPLEERLLHDAEPFDIMFQFERVG